MIRLGILSDTHGLLRPEVLDRLGGCDWILHAGDVGDPAILDQLEAIAPVFAVRGNTDSGPGLSDLPETFEGDFEGLDVRMVHRREDVPAAWLRGAGLVVHGHSHRPELDWHGNDLLILNPGACGHARFRLPLTVAVVTLDDRRLSPEIFAVAC